MNIIEIKSLDQPGVELFSTLTEAQLRNRIDSQRGIFIAESPKVIRVALQAGYEPVALLCEQQLTGYTLTRGVLCAMRRMPERPVVEVCKDARRVVVIQGVVDTTNIGAIFRSAAALGIDAVLLTRDSCDPLNRRAVRVSMGTVFLIPWTWLDSPASSLHELGFRTAAMALTDDSIALDNPQLKAEQRLAIIMGTEGDGLPHTTIVESDYVVRIPMAHSVDSLNVAAAGAIAFWELCK